MSIKNTLAAHVTLHPIQAAIHKFSHRHGVTYWVDFANYFDDERGEGWELADGFYEQHLPTLAKILELIQAEIARLRTADIASDGSDAT